MIHMPVPEKPLFGMILFPSCGNGLAHVLEIVMNNNIVSHTTFLNMNVFNFIMSYLKPIILYFSNDKIKLFVEYFAIKVPLCYLSFILTGGKSAQIFFQPIL